MLTPQTLQKLQTEQKKLDEFIIQKKKITDADGKKSFIRTKIALLVEIEKVKEELIDCLHFYLSWANSFQIDFADYKFQKLAPETDYNELLLALFSETEAFSINVPWKVLKPKMLITHEKSWEDSISKLDPKTKDYEKKLKDFREAKEKTRKDIEKWSNHFLDGINEEKNKASFHRWLIIFEELAQKLGMNEKDIENAYMAKNKIN
ncbi:8343_t:CDS:2 [Funneliformis geosporum]|uniref:8343_t:CDS:1 n=1 Tax=Funneliformis geosporum TaxID=1117311 RepID=A0A9W4T4K9_9GLOM|nr:8343_t:CDS:2 [Funneliformis geosporum]